MVLIFKYSKDLEQGLQSCIQYIRAHNTGYEPVLDIGRKTASWEMRLDNKLRAHADQWIEESVLTATKLARIFLGDSYQPKAVYCQHERIKGTDYPRYFGTAIEFGAPFDGIILDREDLRSPNPINDQEVHRFLLGYLDARVLRADKDLAGAVHSLLTKLIPTGKFSIDVVADQLAVHRRTLQRRLRDTGSNFAELLDECRAQMARDILLNSDVPMANLAQMLGYADQSAFNHAFRRWYKTTPSRWSERRRR
jgi:AraC-like DNA-binding protein